MPPEDKWDRATAVECGLLPMYCLPLPRSYVVLAFVSSGPLSGFKPRPEEVKGYRRVWTLYRCERPA